MSLRSRFARLTFALALLAALPAHAEWRSFEATNVGPIPDNSPSGRVLTFNVSGLTRPLRSVRLSLTLNHRYQGDLAATLTAPLGSARLLVFGRSGVRRGSQAPGSGSGSDLNGEYVFADTGAAGWWQETQSAPGVLAPGEYRSTTGGSEFSLHGGCPTSIDVAFEDLPASVVNGQWSLMVADLAFADTGSISAARLELDEQPSTIFASSFEPTAALPELPPPGLPVCQRAFADFSGNGLSDFGVVRPDGNQLRWSIRHNLGSATAAAEYSFTLGVPFDIAMEFDFDGDGLSDAAAWTSGTPAYFSIRRSTRPTAPPVIVFLGETGDDPVMAGDYDGDGRDDPAVLSVGQLPFLVRIRLSSTGQLREFPINDPGPLRVVFPMGGYDFNGDGLADVAVQKANPAQMNEALFEVYSGRDGSLLQSFAFGSLSDIVMAGNQTGSRVDDLRVIRASGGLWQNTVRDTASGTILPTVTYGSGNDLPQAGDYDGDGLLDLSVWRPSTGQFLNLGATTPGWSVSLGASGAVPVGFLRLK